MKRVLKDITVKDTESPMKTKKETNERKIVTDEMLDGLDVEIPYKWRVQSSGQYSTQCVAYIDARDVIDLFNNVVGKSNWQRKYETINGVLFCLVGIKMYGDEWVWKSDCGTESNIEQKKGESSDAFKRAAVSWGVGRFLYDLEIVKLKSVIDGKDFKGKDRYVPADEYGKKIWDVNQHIQNMKSKKQSSKQEAPKPVPEKQEKKKVEKPDPLASTSDWKEVKTLRENAGYSADDFQTFLQDEFGKTWKEITTSEMVKLKKHLQDKAQLTVA